MINWLLLNKKINLIAILGIIVNFGYAQNLVYNHSFEDTLSCPTDQDQLYNAKGWGKPTHSSSDYLNVCATIAVGIPRNVLGEQNTHSGNGYSAIYTFCYALNWTYKEYIQGHLTDTLKANKTYCVSFYTSLAEQMAYNCNNIGVYFSKDSIYTNTDSLLPYTPQVQNNFSNSLNDTSAWTLVSGSFVATGGEKYLIVGNFDLPANLDTMRVIPQGWLGYINGSYYYIDDISVEEIKPVNAGVDTITITKGDSVQIGNNMDTGSFYSWSPNYFINDTNALNPIVKPQHTQTYYVTKKQCSVTTIDSITVLVNTVGINELTERNHLFHLYPNPNNGNMQLDYHLNANDNGLLFIYDLSGKLISTYKLNSTNTSMNIDAFEMNAGVYFYEIKVNEIKIKTDKLIIIK